MIENGVLIVGGGIAGLATAAGLARAGIPCEIVERAEAWAPVGAGIVLGVNAMRVIRELGIEDAVAATGARLGRGAITDHRGRVLGITDFSLLEPEFGPTIALHRAALHEALLSAAGCVPVSLGTSVEKLETHAGHALPERARGDVHRRARTPAHLARHVGRESRGRVSCRASQGCSCGGEGILQGLFGGFSALLCF